MDARNDETLQRSPSSPKPQSTRPNAPAPNPNDEIPDQSASPQKTPPRAPGDGRGQQNSSPSWAATTRTSPRRAISSRSGYLFAGPGPSVVDGPRLQTSTSRPETSGSRISTTHIPSVAANAFFRPMSSQRLQAQRGGRPPTTEHYFSNNDSRAESVSNVDERSVTSDFTMTRDRQDYETLPPSRGTDAPSHDPRDQASLHTTGNTVRSAGESTRPLQSPTDQLTPSSPGRQYTGETAMSPARSTFRNPARSQVPFSARNGLPENKPASLESFAAQLSGEKLKNEAGKTTGRNHQYFPGNTIFCFGGRFQNTRDRPVNVLTGLLVVVPAILFFVFS